MKKQRIFKINILKLALERVLFSCLSSKNNKLSKKYKKGVDIKLSLVYNESENRQRLRKKGKKNMKKKYKKEVDIKLSLKAFGIGTIIQEDDTDTVLPFLVKFDDGYELWLNSSEMKKVYQLVSQSTEKNVYDEWVEHEGTYKECLQEMKRHEKCYIQRLDNPEGENQTIVKTKGWT